MIIRNIIQLYVLAAPLNFHNEAIKAEIAVKVMKGEIAVKAMKAENVASSVPAKEDWFDSLAEIAARNEFFITQLASFC